MRLGFLLMGWVVLVGLAGCAGQVLPRIPADLSRWEAQRILVTFVDRGIDRKVRGNPADPYQPRLGYASSSWSLAEADALARDYRLRRIAEWPVTVLGVFCVVFESIDAASAEDLVKRLAGDKRVESVQTMRKFKVSGPVAPLSAAPARIGEPYAALQHGFRELQIELAQRWSTGRGVRVAVIDTAVDAQHPDLVGRVEASLDLAPTDARADGNPSHGTAVAGIIGANARNGVGIAGIAPDAELLSLGACWVDVDARGSAVCNTYTLALALNEAVRRDAKVINLSLTGPQDPLLERILQEALQHGAIVVASESSDPSEDHFPANLPGVIAVRNADVTAHETSVARSAFRVLAPGSEILTTQPNASYDFVTGSSFAAAHISGIVALLAQIQPSLDSAKVFGLLTSQAAPSAAAGLPNACAAVAHLMGQSSCPPLLASSSPAL